MKTERIERNVKELTSPDLNTEEITEFDQQAYLNLVSTELSPDQIERIVTPAEVYYIQDSILAVHWHPEFIPMELIMKRVRASFPNSNLELIIPTQHNDLNSLNGYTGVEVDCYSQEFNRKVQLLVHFENSRVENADVFRNMLSHTFQYRYGQLYEFIDTILEPSMDYRMQQAASQTGADEKMVKFVRTCVSKIKKLIEKNFSETPREMLRNKLLKYYIDMLRDHYDEAFINRTQIFLKAVKAIVKANFSMRHFYETHEVIEEVRSLGGGIVVPHPEQFWPILLADYDVDGYEVWNPQSRDYTEFLINVVHRQNESRGGKPILIFMGDDCHMGEKAKEPRYQDTAKASRQIGYQPAWDDPAIRKSLILANVNRRRVIEEYKSRLNG